MTMKRKQTGRVTPRRVDAVPQVTGSFFRRPPAPPSPSPAKTVGSVGPLKTQLNAIRRQLRARTPKRRTDPATGLPALPQPYAPFGKAVRFGKPQRRPRFTKTYAFEGRKRHNEFKGIAAKLKGKGRSLGAARYQTSKRLPKWID